MAFITSETVKNIRNALKKEFPEVKFSVRKEDHSGVNVTIMKSSYFDNDVHTGINHYWIDSSDYPEATKKFVNRVNEIIRTVGGYWDESDAMTDYFHTAFYYNIEAGQWDKPHTKVEK